MYLVPVLFTFYIQCVLKLKKNNSGAKRLIAKNNYMFRPIAGIFKDGRYWPKHVVIFLLLNTIISPYYHSCGFMTDIYLTIIFAIFCHYAMHMFCLAIELQS